MAKMYFRYGAMECGKTTALLQVAYNYKKNGLNAIIVKPERDKKGENKVVSRIGIEREVDVLLKEDEKLMDIVNVENLDCIIVDEVELMQPIQVKELWIIAKLYDVPVICYGLKTTFKGELFTGSKPAIELADELEELPTICSCGKKAKFNARLINGEYVIDGPEVAIDGIDATYEPLCGECYIKKVLKLEKVKKLKK